MFDSVLDISHSRTAYPPDSDPRKYRSGYPGPVHEVPFVSGFSRGVAT